MKNVDKLTAALTEWLQNILKSVLPNVKISNNSGIGKVMNGFLGIDLNNYNIWNELGFLTVPIIENFLSPYLQRYLQTFPEDKIEEMATKMADSCIEQAKAKGSINVFGIEMGVDAFEGLKEILEKNFK